MSRLRVPGPVRIALLHNIVSPHVVPLFDRLAKADGVRLKVYFLAETDRNRRWGARIDASFDYEILRNWAIRIGKKDLYTFFINPTIASALLRDGFDVLVSVGWDSLAAQAAFALCKLVRRPYIIWSGSTVHEPSWRRTLTLPIVQTIVSGSDAAIAYGSRARDYLVALGADPKRTFTAFNTVDVEWFARTSDSLLDEREKIRAELGLSEGPVVLYVGQFIERKGAADLLAAHVQLLKRCPEAQLALVGYGQLESRMRRTVAELQIRAVHFFGHVAVSDLPRYYVAADCFALPSHEEVWGLVLNEAAACGLPLVTTERVGAAADLVRPWVNGFVVPARDPDALAAALQQALGTPNKLGAASRRIVAGMTYDQNVEAIMAALRSALTPS
jgi:glycosyltransferase involved in cell wall biosynthesis